LAWQWRRSNIPWTDIRSNNGLSQSGVRAKAIARSSPSRHKSWRMPIVDSSLGDSNLAPSHFPVSSNTSLHMTYQVRTSRRRFIAALAGLLLVCRKAFARNGGTLDGDSVRLEKNEDGIRLVHINGDKHGYDSLSLILSELDPGQGPPLHTHECEELHVIYSGTVNYLVGGERFTL